jgi:hypothetical protein
MGTVFSDDIGTAAVHAVFDAGKGAVGELRHKEP